MTSISQNDIISQPGQEGGILYTNADRLEDEWDENVSLEGEGPAAMMPRVDVDVDGISEQGNDEVADDDDLISLWSTEDELDFEEEKESDDEA